MSLWCGDENKSTWRWWSQKLHRHYWEALEEYERIDRQHLTCFHKFRINKVTFLVIEDEVVEILPLKQLSK